MESKGISNEVFNEMKSTFSRRIPKKETESMPESSPTVKSKVLETFNNLRYEFGRTTTLKKDTPLWLLGICYSLPSTDGFDFMKEIFQDSDTGRRNNGDDKVALKLFVEDFNSRFWFTYRKGYQRLNGSSLSSDTGWGCMLRTAQMMIAQGLVMHFLNRNWRWRPNNHNLNEAELHRKIIKWFLDEPSRKSPFGLHTLVEFGENYNCKPGNWYGPGTVAYIMQHACDLSKSTIPDLKGLHIYVTQDGTVYSQDVLEILEPTKNADGSVSQPSVILLIPVRLGAASFNTEYMTAVQTMFTLPQSIGVIGGKPKHSLYFVGYQDENLLYLDPHYCQPAHTRASFTNKCIHTYHNDAPRKVSIKKVDPSCCLGFYCRDKNDYENFVSEVNRILTARDSSRPNQNLYPIFSITEGSIVDLKPIVSDDAILEVFPTSKASPSSSATPSSSGTAGESSRKMFDFSNKFTNKKSTRKTFNENDDDDFIEDDFEII